MICDKFAQLCSALLDWNLAGNYSRAQLNSNPVWMECIVIQLSANRVPMMIEWRGERMVGRCLMFDNTKLHI